MNIYILSKSEYIYSTQRIMKEARNRGHHVKVVDYAKCMILMEKNSSEVIFESNNILPIPTVIVPRIGSVISPQGATIVNEFELNETFTTASSYGISLAQSKIKSLQLLAQNGIPIPKTLFSITHENVEEQLKYMGKPPYIIKTNAGTQGMGVVLADSVQSAKSILEAFYNMDKRILLQEYIEESKGEDVRAFVVGGKVVAAMKRIGKSDDFRSNIHRGGVGKAIKLTDEETNIAIKSAALLNLEVAGVDIIQSDKGPLVLEVNASPGLQGIESATKVNIAMKIILHLEKKEKEKYG